MEGWGAKQILHRGYLRGNRRSRPHLQEGVASGGREGGRAVKEVGKSIRSVK